MRSVLTLAIKDLRLLTRDWLGMFFIVVFPVVMGVFFGLIGVSFSGEPESGSTKVAVVDADDSPMSRLFVERLGEIEAISAELMSRSEAVESVRKGRLVAFVGIPKGFGETAGVFWLEGPPLELGVDPSRPAEGAMMQGMIMQAMGGVIQHRFQHPGSLRPQIGQAIESLESRDDIPPGRRAFLRGLLAGVDRFLGTLDEQMGAADSDSSGWAPSMEMVRIETVDVIASARASDGDFHDVVEKIHSPWDISFPAAIMWGVMGCVAGFAVSVAQERTAGTFFRLQIAPITRTQVLAGKALACFIAVIGVVVFMMTLGLILGIQLASPGLLVMAAICTALGFVGLMMFISVLGKSEQAVAGAGWAIIVVMCMFGGGMVPLAFMPSFMKTMSHFSPVKWGILALEGAVWRGFSFTEMLLPCGILLGVGACGFALGARILSRTDA